jgi:hypothetical protein
MYCFGNSGRLTFIVPNAWKNGRAGIARRFESVLRATATTRVANGAHVPFSHGHRQVRDDVIMLTVI